MADSVMFCVKYGISRQLVKCVLLTELNSAIVQTFSKDRNFPNHFKVQYKNKLFPNEFVDLDDPVELLQRIDNNLVVLADPGKDSDHINESDVSGDDETVESIHSAKVIISCCLN